MRCFLVLGLTGLLAAACGGGGDGGYLAKDTVTSLPAGDATGSGFAGVYEVELYTSDCSGRCPTIDYGLFTWSICDVGDKVDDEVQVSQTDGLLQVDSDGSLMVTRLSGGIYGDGTFDVGGWSTEEGGDVQIFARAEGALADLDITATAKARAVGRAEGVSINCTATYEISGNLVGENP